MSDDYGVAASGGGKVDGGVRRGAGDRMVVTAGVGVHRTGRREAAELRCSGEDAGRRGGVSGEPRGKARCQRGAVDRENEIDRES